MSSAALAAGSLISPLSCTPQYYGNLNYPYYPIYDANPAPNNWSSLTLLNCSAQAAAAAPNASGQDVCPNDGTVCSSLTSCSSAFDSAYAGFQVGYASLTSSGVPRPDLQLAPYYAVAWGGTARDFLSCQCPTHATYDAGGSCYCGAGYLRDVNNCVAACPSGKSEWGGECQPTGKVVPKYQGRPPADCKQCTGDPVNIGVGGRFLSETVFASPTLSLVLFYNAMPPMYLPIRPYPFGQAWSSNFGLRVRLTLNDKVVALRADGKFYQFVPGAGNSYTTDPDTPDSLTKQVDGSGNITGWQYARAEDDALEQYDASGNLTSITARNGQVTALTYSDASTPITIAPQPGLLIAVTDPFGRALNFTYNGASRVVTMTDPAGNVYTFTYDEASSIVLSGQPLGGNLTSVTFPDAHKRIY
ncbi:MAG TPA: DUF6531 domain-containing protein [Burkholderiales bacterium]|nr:DUF6531 domain-containing protein [Burkholderiales bacterium]